jgi:hypothetical protein
VVDAYLLRGERATGRSGLHPRELLYLTSVSHHRAALCGQQGVEAHGAGGVLARRVGAVRWLPQLAE